MKHSLKDLEALTRAKSKHILSHGWFRFDRTLDVVELLSQKEQCLLQLIALPLSILGVKDMS